MAAAKPPKGLRFLDCWEETGFGSRRSFAFTGPKAHSRAKLLMERLNESFPGQNHFELGSVNGHPCIIISRANVDFFRWVDEDEDPAVIAKKSPELDPLGYEPPRRMLGLVEPKITPKLTADREKAKANYSRNTGAQYPEPEKKTGETAASVPVPASSTPAPRPRPPPTPAPAAAPAPQPARTPPAALPQPATPSDNTPKTSLWGRVQSVGSGIGSVVSWWNLDRTAEAYTRRNGDSHGSGEDQSTWKKVVVKGALSLVAAGGAAVAVVAAVMSAPVTTIVVAGAATALIPPVARGMVALTEKGRGALKEVSQERANERQMGKISHIKIYKNRDGVIKEGFIIDPKSRALLDKIKTDKPDLVPHINKAVIEFGAAQHEWNRHSPLNPWKWTGQPFFGRNPELDSSVGNILQRAQHLKEDALPLFGVLKGASDREYLNSISPKAINAITRTLSEMGFEDIKANDVQAAVLKAMGENGGNGKSKITTQSTVADVREALRDINERHPEKFAKLLSSSKAVDKYLKTSNVSHELSENAEFFGKGKKNGQQTISREAADAVTKLLQKIKVDVEGENGKTNVRAAANLVLEQNSINKKNLAASSLTIKEALKKIVDTADHRKKFKEALDAKMRPPLAR